MKEIMRRNATVFSAIGGLLLIFILYTFLGTVDVVFMKGDLQVARMDNVNFVSCHKLDEVDFITGEDLTYTYESGEEVKTYNADFAFRMEVAKTVALNLISPAVQKSANFVVSIIPNLAKPLSKLTNMKPIDPIVLTAQ